jgi:uncharacterized C2H2 Zn-finger protein
MALNDCLARLSRETSPAVLFPRPPELRFAPERDTCCRGERLVVHKTQCKKVLSMTGPFIARETVLRCPACSRLFRSETLPRLVARHCNVAHEVLVFAGEALFRRHRTSLEVRAELIARNVRLSVSEIEYLGRKFIMYLALGHRQAGPRIRREMELAGGYVLHIDATHDGDAPALMSGMDGLSETVLANVKLPSEHSEHIVPFLRELQADYGTPRACVHDMGNGILRAVAEVFPGVPDFICHFHFLRDIGKDFLEPAYGKLRNLLRGHAVSSCLHELARGLRQCLDGRDDEYLPLLKAVEAAEAPDDADFLTAALTYSLTLWALRGKHDGKGYGFPFDRPLFAFAERLLELDRRLPELLDLLLGDDEPYDNQPVFKLAREVAKIGADAALCQTVDDLRRRCRVFDSLREAMRIAPTDGSNGLNDEGEAESMTTIRQGVEQFRRNLDADPELAVDPLGRKMAEQIDKYGDKLFADPICVDTPKGPVTIHPQRTNNIMEQFFRDRRRAHRRKTGNDSMCRTLHAMLADTPLVKNLDNPSYMEILLDGKRDLVELFATLAASRTLEPRLFQTNSERLLPGFRSLINASALPERLIRALGKPSWAAESNRIL